MKTIKLTSAYLFFILFITSTYAQQSEKFDQMSNLYPWCIVAFDSLERSPSERIQMLKEFGFTKYAYDWRDKHLDDMEKEITLAAENNIEIISVWLWLNAKRDSLGKLSPGNERMFEILESLKVKTTLWLSFNNNFFKDLTHDQSLKRSVEMIKFINNKAKAMGCNVALYNHRDWFGNPYNQLEIIKSIPEDSLSIVFNFHHAKEYLDQFSQIVKQITPYLIAVNLNGMKKEGPKILSIGEGDYEKEMIKNLIDEGFDGPWGMLGHIENKDVKLVLKRNIHGFKTIITAIK